MNITPRTTIVIICCILAGIIVLIGRAEQKEREQLEIEEAAAEAAEAREAARRENEEDAAAAAEIEAAERRRGEREHRQQMELWRAQDAWGAKEAAKAKAARDARIAQGIAIGQAATQQAMDELRRKEAASQATRARLTRILLESRKDLQRLGATDASATGRYYDCYHDCVVAFPKNLPDRRQVEIANQCKAQCAP